MQTAGDHYDIIGGAICGSFLVFGLLSVLLYRPWRNMIDRKRHLRPIALEDGNGAVKRDDVDVIEPHYADATAAGSKTGKTGNIQIDADEVRASRA